MEQKQYEVYKLIYAPHVNDKNVQVTDIILDMLFVPIMTSMLEACEGFIGSDGNDTIPEEVTGEPEPVTLYFKDRASQIKIYKEVNEKRAGTLYMDFETYHISQEEYDKIDKWEKENDNERKDKSVSKKNENN